MLGKIKKKQGGTSYEGIVNGILNSYKASTTAVSADTFISFVDRTVGSYSTFGSSSNNYGFKATKIDDERVIVGYYNSGMCIRILRISGTSITMGAEYQFYSSSIYLAALAVINSGTLVSIIFGSTSYWYYKVYTINGLTLTLSIDTTQFVKWGGTDRIGSGIQTYDGSYTVALMDVSGSSNYGAYCTPLSLSSTGVVTKGTGVQLGNTNYNGSGAQMTIARSPYSNIVYIGYQLGSSTSNRSCLLIAVSVSGTSASKYTAKAVITEKYGASSGLITVGSYTLYLYNPTSTPYYLYGVLCTGTSSITVGASYQISTTCNTRNLQTGHQLTSNSLYLVMDSGSGSLYGIKITTSGSTLTVNSTQYLISGYSSNILYYYQNTLNLIKMNNDNDFFLTYAGSSNNAYSRGVVLRLNRTIIKAASASNIKGLTKTDCLPNVAGQVYTL